MRIATVGLITDAGNIRAQLDDAAVTASGQRQRRGGIAGGTNHLVNTQGGAVSTQTDITAAVNAAGLITATHRGQRANGQGLAILERQRADALSSNGNRRPILVGCLTLRR